MATMMSLFLFCGTPTEVGFQVWSSEAYVVTNVAAGGTYLVSICDGYGAWVAEITVVDAVTNEVIASTEGTTDGSECSLEFTTPNAGDILIIFNDANSCGGASNQNNNGLLTLDCVSGAGPCPIPTCDAGQTTNELSQTVCPGEGINLTVTDEDLTLGAGDYTMSWAFYQPDGAGGQRHHRAQSPRRRDPHRGHIQRREQSRTRRRRRSRPCRC